MSNLQLRQMPDIQSAQLTQLGVQLDWVGMSDIHQPLMIRDGGIVRQVQSHVQVYVDLGDPTAKGIHMSRLYLILDEHADTRPLSTPGLKLLLSSLLESHRGLSTRAFVRFAFDYYLRRQALVSENSGWNSYPVEITGSRVDGPITLEVKLAVQYSSTCPASAALARQLIQEQFAKDFGAAGKVDAAAVHEWLGTEQGIIATPHSQRSTGTVLVPLTDGLEDFPITSLIDGLENTLKTPVQTAVKREDEQAFAELNAANPIFVEDAARLFCERLKLDPRIGDFRVIASHQESLHSHDAVSMLTQGETFAAQSLDPTLFASLYHVG